MLDSAKHISVSPGEPFDLNQRQAYQNWRAQKLQDYPTDARQLMVEIADPSALTPDEKTALLANLAKTNIALYKCTGKPMGKTQVRELGQQLGLVQLDNNLCSDEGISALQVSDNGQKRGYIPYTNKRLSWHTDGYYNDMALQIHGIVMHCVSPAAEGGENLYLDHEILYQCLRDHNPDYIRALMHPQAMIIPPNIEQGEFIRGETVGPVFSIRNDGHLHMRYSARTRNIQWRDDADTQAATAFITDYLASDSPYIFRYRLNANEGVISNNVLHNRTSFENDNVTQRLLYRARYVDRVATPLSSMKG